MESPQAPAQVRPRPLRSAKTSGAANSGSANEDHLATAESIAAGRQSKLADQEYAATETPRASARIDEQARAAPPARRATPLVMIDPGHGGYDPGTEAAGTVAEKEVALTIASMLRDALNARGVNAQMTRRDDVFVSLGTRTQMANRAQADLFISIHLNSSPEAATAGIETYYLNNTTDRATMRLARMENGGASGYSAGRGANLDYILTDLRQGYKANESASIARMIEAEAVADIDSDLGLTVNELGAKMGPFYVLVGAEMPAVLVECGFLSNPEEARRLTAPRYQQAIADGIATAVVHYFNADAAVGNL
jgi:N-acetylmuramoyl-L-alanine amidase